MEILDNVPEKIMCGDTVVWDAEFSDYLSTDGWTAAAYFVPATGAPTSVAGATQDSGFRFTLTATATAAMATGDYKWFIRVTKAGEKVTVSNGSVEFKPNPTAAGDQRSWVKKMLDALEAAMLGTASSDVMEYTIRDRSLKKMTRKELRAERDRFAALYAKELQDERLEQGLGIETNVLVQFKEPS